jgi:hypothetical protein
MNLKNLAKLGLVGLVLASCSQKEKKPQEEETFEWLDPVVEAKYSNNTHMLWISSNPEKMRWKLLKHHLGDALPEEYEELRTLLRSQEVEELIWTKREVLTRGEKSMFKYYNEKLIDFLKNGGIPDESETILEIGTHLDFTHGAVQDMAGDMLYRCGGCYGIMEEGWTNLIKRLVWPKVEEIYKEILEERKREPDSFPRRYYPHLHVTYPTVSLTTRWEELRDLSSNSYMHKESDRDKWEEEVRSLRKLIEEETKDTKTMKQRFREKIKIIEECTGGSLIGGDRGIADAPDRLLCVISLPNDFTKKRAVEYLERLYKHSEELRLGVIKEVGCRMPDTAKYESLRPQKGINLQKGD